MTLSGPTENLMLPLRSTRIKENSLISLKVHASTKTNLNIGINQSRKSGMIQI
jgi:hypothetical protein